MFNNDSQRNSIAFTFITNSNLNEKIIIDFFSFTNLDSSEYIIDNDDHNNDNFISFKFANSILNSNLNSNLNESII